MDLIERLKKKNIINNDNTFNSNRKQYNRETVNLPTRKDIQSYSSNIPNYENMKKIDTKTINKDAFSHIKEGNLWNSILKMAKQDNINIGNTNNNPVGTINLNNNMSINNISEPVKLKQGANLNNTDKKDIYNREVKKTNKLPVQKIATEKETKDAQEYTITQRLADEEAKRKNENIAKGGVDAFNEYADTVLSGIHSGAQGVVGGITNVITTTGALGTKVASNIVGGIGNKELQEKVNETYDNIVGIGKDINDRANYTQYVNGKIDNNFVRTSGQISHTISQMAFSAGTGEVIGIGGTAAQGLFVGGNSAQEVLNKNKDNIFQASVTGIAKGYVSALTEKMFDANILTKGAEKSSIQDLINKKISEKISSNLGKEFANKTVGIVGENIEELVEDNLGNLIDKLVNNKKFPKEGFKEWLSNTGETIKVTTLSTLVMNLLGLGGGTFKEIESDMQAKQYINEAQKIIEKENLAITYDSSKIQINNNQSEQGNIQNNTQEQQITQTENKMSQNQISNEINKNLDNSKVPIQKYQYEMTDNKKINNLRQDMSKYWTNSEETKALGSVIEKIIEDKGYNVRLDNNLNKDGNIANAKIKTLDNGEVEIRINPNAKNTGEFLLMHEVTHSIATQEMKDLVIDYASKNQEFNKSLQELKEIYQTEDVSNEVLADISGQLFGKQEFINNLSIEKPNVFKRIYNKIIEWANKITGNSKEGLFIRDLKNKWQEAYRTQSNNLKGNTYYSIQQDANGNRYVKVDTDQDIFDGIDKKDYNKIAKMYMQDYLMGKTNLASIDTAIIDRKSASKYTNPQQRTSYMSEKMQLTPELKNVLEIAQKDSASLPTKENSKYKSWEYYKFKFELGERNFEGTINIGIDKDRNKHFYEINKIRFTGISSVSTNSQHKTDSINNSILPTKENVNRTTSNNYIQESENNTKNSNKSSFSLPTKGWQEYLNENFKTTGTRTNLEDIKLPTKEYIDNKGNYITNKDYEALNKIYEKEGKTNILPIKKTNTENKGTQILDKLHRDKKNFKDSMDILAQKVVNKGHYVDKLAKETNNPELKYAYDRALNSQAEGQYVVGIAQTDNTGKKIGKSINEIWKPVEDSKLIKEFSEYLLHKHNIDRSRRGKYVFGKEITATDSTKIASDLIEKHPEFKAWEKEIKQFNDNNLNNLKEAGLLNQDMIEYLTSMYPNYVSIARAIEGNQYGKTDKTGVGVPLKKAVGGSADIQPLKDAMAEQVIRIKRLVNENRIGKELVKSMKNSIVEENVDIQYTPELLMDTESLVSEDSITGDKYYVYFENGNQKKIKINNELYESLKKSEQIKLEKTLPLKAIQKISNIHRGLLTSNNPVFIVTNFFKDFQDGMFNSKYSRKFIPNYWKALGEIKTKGKYYESYMANGGMTNTYFDYNKGVKKEGNNFFEKVRNANEIVEQAPRLAEFISTLEDGKSLNEALYNAAEVTTNFKRGGDIAKALNRNGAEFLNASIQGFDKQFRNFTGQNGAKGYVNLLAKATILGVLPSVLNHLLLDDDDDYKDLPQSTKDLYYLFKTSDNKFIRIPKGRVVSIFGAAARRTLEMTQGQEDAWEGFGSTITNQIAPNNPLEDNIVAPIKAVASNKTWYGSDLVSSRLQKELPKNQYDETTDEFSKWLGNKLNKSPKKINYLLDQYSGGIGDILLPMITPQAKDNVFIDKFTTNSILKNKNVGKFYETIDKQTQIANDSLATDEDQLQLKYLNSKLKEINDLYKKKREIQLSNIHKEDKKKQVLEVQKEINNIVENALDNYKKNSVKNNSGSVGEYQYYKDGKRRMERIIRRNRRKGRRIKFRNIF